MNIWICLQIVIYRLQIFFSNNSSLCCVFSYTCFLPLHDFFSRVPIWGDKDLRKLEEALWPCVYKLLILTFYLFFIILSIIGKLSCTIFSMKTSTVPLAGVSQKTELEMLSLLSPNMDQSMAPTRASNVLYALLPPWVRKLWSCTGEGERNLPWNISHIRR